MDSFEGRIGVVTGTANPRGIGFAICRTLAELGCKLVLADIDGEGAEARAQDLVAKGADALAVRVDMSDHGSVEALAEATYGRFGATHILVLNHVAAPIGPGQSLLTPEPELWESGVRVNLLGVVYGIKAFVPRMIAGGEHGHVLATTSGAGASGTMYGDGPYAVTKAGITSVMECLYGQLRDADADIVAGLIFPPLTNTFPSDEWSDMILQMMRTSGVPVAMAQPDEVAAFTVEAIRRDSFWAHPDVADDQRQTGGRHREAIEWENALYRTRAEILVSRSAPDGYLWGPSNDVMSGAGS
jgi:NAD(P)-dependent dehydrogenase (short-subunit alcohol dehydrogenase family)